MSDNGGLQQSMNANNVLRSSISNPKQTNRIVLVNVVDINEQPTFTTSCSSEKSREVLREYDISLNSAYDSSKFLQMEHSVQGVRNSAASFVQMLPLNPSLRSKNTKERMTFKMTKGLYDPRGYSLSWGEGTRHGTVQKIKKLKKNQNVVILCVHYNRIVIFVKILFLSSFFF